MIRTEAMKLLAFKFQEEKCVVLGEDDQVARGAPPPAPGPAPTQKKKFQKYNTICMLTVTSNFPKLKL